MGTALFGVIDGPDLKAASEQLKDSKSYLDGIELRLDRFQATDLPELKAFLLSCGLPVIFTVRRKDQGGSFNGSEQQRLSLIESLCALQPAYVDLEWDVDNAFRKKLFESHPQIKFISSYHDLQGTPEDLAALYAKIKTPFAHLYKMALTAKSPNDALKLLTFASTHPDQGQLIATCMGKEGSLTRILAPIVGCALTYASTGREDSSQLGLFTAQEMQERYHFRKLNKETSIYCLIGNPVDKSLGPIVHNAVFEQLQLNAVYVKAALKSEELELFFQLTKHLPFKGFSITMPHKEAVIAFLDQISIQTRVIGACNTIHHTGNLRIGYNTDGIGALNALEKKAIVYGKHLVFVGAGGAAKGLVFEAVERGAYVTIINRTPEKAIEIAKNIGGEGGGWELFPKVCKAGYDALINCTPDSDLIEEEWILPEKIVMDLVYIPKKTPFLVKAERKKCQIVFGYEMFIGQALEQLRIWFPEGTPFDQATAIIQEKVAKELG
jgi:3-dehydroquinate dehydratase / shikimate dehydrogenase